MRKSKKLLAIILSAVTLVYGVPVYADEAAQYVIEQTGTSQTAVAEIEDVIDCESTSDIDRITEFINENQEDTYEESDGSDYQSKRLFVFTDALTSDYGAAAVIYDETLELYILQFDTEQEAEGAFEQLSADYGDNVFIDEIIDSDDCLTSAATYTNWGVSSQGLDEIVAADWDTDVVIAIIDTGCDTSNSVFDGRISDLSYDWESGTYTVDTDTNSYGHGTHVAGIAASATPENVQLMILDVETGSGTISSLYIMYAIQYAVKNGADIINCSLGSDTSGYLDHVISETVRAGVWMVCAAGNDGMDSVYYPASSSDTIAVSAITSSDTIASYSNYGSAIDFAGPGSSVTSAWLGGTTATMSGTSMAAPNVSAALACILCVLPGLSRDELYEVAAEYCADLGDSGKDVYYGWGKIYLETLIDDCASSDDATDGTTDDASDESTDDTSDDTTDEGTEEPVIVSLSDCTVTLSATSYTYTGAAKTPTVTVTHNGVKLTSGTDYTVAYSNNINAGTATVTVTGKNNYTGTVKKTFTINKASQSLTVKAAASSIYVGKTTTVSVSGAKGAVSYKSSSTSVATVSSAGKVTGKKVGTVTITVTSAATANYNAASKTVTIKVKPAATSSLTISKVSSGIKLTWKKVTGATGYYVYRNGVKIKTITSGSTLTYTDTGLTNGSKYVYKAYAYASTGTGVASASKTTYFLTTPTVSSAKNTSSKKATVTWNKNTKASGYQIKYVTGSTTKTVTVSGYSTVKKVLSSLTKGKTYKVYVRSYKKVGSAYYYSAWSSAKSVKISK